LEFTKILYHFGIAFALSFIGTLPPGIINMTIAMTAIRKFFKAAVVVSVGAVTVEWFQAFLSIKFSSILLKNPSFDQALQVTATIVFIALAIYFLFFASTKPPKPRENSGLPVSEFFRGAAVASMNVLIFPYWIFYGTYLRSEGWLEKSDAYYAVFSTGVMFGAFAVFLVYAKIGRLIVARAEKAMRVTNLVVGFLFLSFAIYQVIGFFIEV